jgi:hypothetical protein
MSAKAELTAKAEMALTAESIVMAGIEQEDT